MVRLPSRDLEIGLGPDRRMGHIMTRHYGSKPGGGSGASPWRRTQGMHGAGPRAAKRHHGGAGPRLTKIDGH